MTDLKGELLPRLLNERQREAVFVFLETANSLIFGDAILSCCCTGKDRSTKQTYPICCHI